MSWLLPYLVVCAGVAVTVGLLAWMSRVARRRGVAGSAMRAAMASYAEAFQATAHQSHYEIQAQSRHKVPIPAPDDPREPSDGEGIGSR